MRNRRLWKRPAPFLNTTISPADTETELIAALNQWGARKIKVSGSYSVIRVSFEYDLKPVQMDFFTGVWQSEIKPDDYIDHTLRVLWRTVYTRIVTSIALVENQVRGFSEEFLCQEDI